METPASKAWSEFERYLVHSEAEETEAVAEDISASAMRAFGQTPLSKAGPSRHGIEEQETSLVLPCSPAVRRMQQKSSRISAATQALVEELNQEISVMPTLPASIPPADPQALQAWLYDSSPRTHFTRTQPRRLGDDQNTNTDNDDSIMSFTSIGGNGIGNGHYQSSDRPPGRLLEIVPPSRDEILADLRSRQLHSMMTDWSKKAQAIEDEIAALESRLEGSA